MPGLPRRSAPPPCIGAGEGAGRLPPMAGRFMAGGGADGRGAGGWNPCDVPIVGTLGLFIGIGIGVEGGGDDEPPPMTPIGRAGVGAGIGVGPGPVPIGRPGGGVTTGGRGCP